MSYARLVSICFWLLLITGALTYIPYAIYYTLSANTNTNTINIINIINQLHLPTRNVISQTMSSLSPGVQYIDINAYSNYNKSSEPIPVIPSSWQQLNQQLLCPVADSSMQRLSFIQYVFDLQFGIDCTDKDRQFVIFDITMEAGSGLGASLLGSLKRNFASALILNRTFVFAGSYEWSSDKPYCQGFDNWECYFLPISSCNARQLLHHIRDQKNNSKVYYSGGPPNHCIFGNNFRSNPNLTHCEHRIIHITGSSGWPMYNGEIKQWTQDTFGIGMMEYEALIADLFIRPQATVRKIIYDKIQKSIIKSLNHADWRQISTQSIIAYPIRASDKCKSITGITGKQYTHQPESTCFTPDEHIQVMNSIKYFTNDTINTVILTSEDASFLDRVVALMHSPNVSEVSHWNVIRNTEDYSVGEGTTTFKDTIKAFDQKLRDGVGTSLERDHIVSALSSLMFQVHLEPQYIVYGDSSTWLKLMWKWLSFLNCNIEPKWHVEGDAKCIELSTPGYLHLNGGFQYKFVRYSQQIWTRLRAENLTPSAFIDRFGVNLTRFGWDDFCEKGFENRIKF